MHHQARPTNAAYKFPDKPLPEYPESNIYNPATRDSVNSLIDYLEKTGKICPRPWCWERFFILFNPRYEPCWLSSWWKTTVEEKKELFRKQLYYLAYRTDRYNEASRFLSEMDDRNWLLKTSDKS